MKFKNNGALTVALLFVLTGCPPKKPHVVLPPAPPEQPVVARTHGEITYGGLATLLIRYKSIVLLIDPVFEPVGPLGPTKAKLDTMRTPGQIQRTKPGALAWDTLPHIDYLLLTDGQPHHLGERAKAGLRKDLKIIAADSVVQDLKARGYSQSKGLSHVQRLMLKKDEDFLFVSVIQSRNPASGERVNGYLLEFDNGRNIFLSGEIVDEAVVREFVYGLRDDGKQIDIMFLYGGGMRTVADKIWQSAGEEMCGLFVGLIQPQAAYILQTDGLDAVSFDEDRLKTKLQEEMYSGQISVPKPGDRIYF